MSNKPQCSDNQGTLPSCAPLAAGFVPYQQDNPATYESCDGLTRGTLFPGLDLPLFNMPNKSNPYAGTPLGELMALDFAVKELNLYLDTHKDDREAFEMFKNYLALAKKGRKEYASMEVFLEGFEKNQYNYKQISFENMFDNEELEEE